MIWVSAIVVVLVLIAVSLYGWQRWGVSDTQRQQAESIAKERSDDADIASHPFVGGPFGRMRRKG